MDPFFEKMGVRADYQFEHCEARGSLHDSSSHILKQCGTVFADAKPDIILVQGDTTTAFIAALAAFYSSIPIAHVEAGLRTGQLSSPWPEEGHRVLIDRLSTYFFAPTEQAKKNLLAEGVSDHKIWVVGNTSIDAIRLAQSFATRKIDHGCRKIAVTVHRRENHGDPLREICTGLRVIAELYSDVRIQFIVHPNPSIAIPVTEMISGVQNIELIEPMDHISFINILEESAFIITDSGGIQEEAPFLGKPVLIVRETTERSECLEAGTARLIGTKAVDIIINCKELLENQDVLTAMSKVHYPFGDGYAGERIARILEAELSKVSL
jgi:UDP-N-acetylglucosamine 2-epimerase (non-hydrolysing)